MGGFVDRLGDLSWLGPNYVDMGWFEVGEGQGNAVPSTPGELAWDKAKKMLAESDWAVLQDVPMLEFQRTAWIEYRRALREIRLQSGFPDNIIWPSKPE